MYWKKNIYISCKKVTVVNLSVTSHLILATWGQQNASLNTLFKYNCYSWLTNNSLFTLAAVRKQYCHLVQYLLFFCSVFFSTNP